jgi:hypothetical protein
VCKGSLFLKESPSPVIKEVPVMAESSRMHCFSYGDFSHEDAVFLIAAHPNVVVLNSPSGFWGKNYGSIAQCWPKDRISELRARGTRVLGYTTSGYAGKGSGGHPLSYASLSNVLEQIERMILLDGVDGIFLDEVDSYPSMIDQNYYKACVDRAHLAGASIWGNAGTNEAHDWLFLNFDIVHCTEQWQAGQSVSPVMLSHKSKIAVAGYGDWTLGAARAAMQDAHSKGVEFAYCGAKDWNTLPTFLIELASDRR